MRRSTNSFGHNYSYSQNFVPSTSLQVLRTRKTNWATPYAAQEAVVSQDLESKLDTFWTWLTEEKGVVPAKICVKPSLTREGVGLLASKNISVGDEFLVVPEKLCINLETVQMSPLGQAVQDVKPWVALALFLLREKADPDSEWRPYIDILPSTLNLPILWSEAELAELEGTQLLQQVAAFKELVSSQYEGPVQEVLERNPALLPPGVVTLESFTWAFAILRSRTFPPLVGDEIALLPLADLVNHASKPIVGKQKGDEFWERRGAGIFDRQQLIAIRSNRRYEMGEQVTVDYGPSRSNAELALDFGFVDVSDLAAAALSSRQGAVREALQLTLELTEEDAFFDDKADIAEINGLQATNYFDLVSGQGPPQDMITFLRLMALGGSDAFLLEALFRDKVWGHLELPVSRENEEAVCQAMIDGCSATLAGFTCSIEQDLRLLKEGHLSLRLKVAVAVRLGEKRVLTEILDWFQARLQGLDNLEYYAERRLRDLGLLDDKGHMTSWVSVEEES